VAGALLDGVDAGPGIRLLGVSVSRLAPGGGPRQLTLDGDGPPRADAARAVDGVRSRFGASAIGPAALLGDDGLGLRRPGDHQWGPGGGAVP